jgi:alcohol dehydrogenase class IV
MSHSLGGLLDSPHGECNAILLETVIEFNFQEVPERYSRVAEAMGVDLRQRRESEVKTALLSAVRLLRCSAGVQKTLGQCGVHSSDISELARRAMLDVCMVTNPRRPSLSDLEVMYERAL